MMSRHIVLVEDELSIRENYTDALKQQNYQVTAYDNKNDAIQAFKSGLPDLVLLDIGLGDDVEAGFEICRELRTLSSTLPIIFLTARDSDFDAISGLRLGADDYITKDINIHQLLARVAALFRRVNAMQERGQGNKRIKHQDLMIDVDCLLVEWKGQRVDLTLTEFWIVHALARIPGHVKNREQLMSEANIFVDDSTVTSHMKRIRKKFKEVDKEFDCVETMYGMGYRWNA
jgi:two-component system OmpR family response regulator